MWLLREHEFENSNEFRIRDSRERLHRLQREKQMMKRLRQMKDIKEKTDSGCGRKTCANRCMSEDLAVQEAVDTVSDKARSRGNTRNYIGDMEISQSI